MGGVGIAASRSDCYACLMRTPSAAMLCAILRPVSWTFAWLLVSTIPDSAAEIKLFDTHIHYSRPDWSAYPPDQALKILAGAGVERALVSSTPDDGTVMLYERDPKRIVPELRPYRSRDDMASWHRDPEVFAYVEQRLQRGIYKGIGEFHLQAGDAGGALMKRFVELAVRHNLILHSHSDAAAIQALFAHDPRARVLWAHAGMSAGPDEVAVMLGRYPNLSVELALRTDVAPNGALDPDWRALFLRYPDRFSIGTDTWVTSRWEELPRYLAAVRGWLGQLPPEVAERIAFGNADRLYGAAPPGR
jgi:hypothetical protein